MALLASRFALNSGGLVIEALDTVLPALLAELCVQALFGFSTSSGMLMLSLLVVSGSLLLHSGVAGQCAALGASTILARPLVRLAIGGDRLGLLLHYLAGLAALLV